MLQSYERVKGIAARVKTLGTAAVGVTKAEPEAGLLDAQAESEFAEADQKRAITEYIQEQTKGLRLDNQVKQVRSEIITEMGSQVLDGLRRSNRRTKAPQFNAVRVLGLINDLDSAFGHLVPRGIELPPAPGSDEPEDP